jgi:hypothetical protein
MSGLRLRVAAGLRVVDPEECRLVTALATASLTAQLDVDDVQVGWVSSEGSEERLPLGKAWAVPFEGGLPVRRFVRRKGQRHLSGLWWCATTGGHVGFESWLERDHLVLLDFDPTVVGIASQPFWLSWTDDAGSRVRHAPDYFTRCRDGSAVVVDCRPVERRKPRDAAKFEATASACERIGWQYRLVGAPDRIRVGNLRWLAGYRHPRHDLRQVGTLLGEVFATPTPLMAGAEAVGDPIAVLPVLFHLLWSHELVADLSVPLTEHSVIRAAAVQ